MAQHTGTVAWFNNVKGFGFLRHKSGADVIVHQTAIEDHIHKNLIEGDAVDFDVETGTNGKLQAVRVRKTA